MASISRREVTGRPRYDVNYREPDGTNRKTFMRKTDAETFASTVEADKARGTYIDRDAGRITFRKYADEWLANQSTEPTTRERLEGRLRVHVYPVLGPKMLAQIKPIHDPVMAGGPLWGCAARAGLRSGRCRRFCRPLSMTSGSSRIRARPVRCRRRSEKRGRSCPGPSSGSRRCGWRTGRPLPGRGRSGRWSWVASGRDIRPLAPGRRLPARDRRGPPAGAAGQQSTRVQPAEGEQGPDGAAASFGA